MSWRLNRTATYWPPLLWPQQRFFPVLQVCSTGGMGAQPHWDMFLIPASSLQLVWSPTGLISNCNCSIGGLRAHSAGCWLSLPHLASNWLNFQCIELYNCSTSTFFLWASQIALIQPVHGHGYILIFVERCTYYLHRCISYFDSPAESEVYIQWIYHESIKLNGSDYCYVWLTIQSNISHLIIHSEMIKQSFFEQFNFVLVICLHTVWMWNSSIWPGGILVV